MNKLKNIEAIRATEEHNKMALQKKTKKEPAPKKKRTPEEIEKAKEKMAKVRLAKGKKASA